MGPLGILLIMVIPVCVLIGYYINTKNNERMKLIERGVNPDEELNISDYRKQTSLKNGILFLSLGLGLFIGHLIVINFENLDSFITYATMLLIFGGIGFLINYFIIKKALQAKIQRIDDDMFTSNIVGEHLAKKKNIKGIQFNNFLNIIIGLSAVIMSTGIVLLIKQSNTWIKEIGLTENHGLLLLTLSFLFLIFKLMEEFFSSKSITYPIQNNVLN